ncbi:retroviral-like aspartic protease family protein [Brevundimonas sp.]|uniref:retroviral-like aspartic protease family protein n=1 Tax=Brevundimonas sp. TaxID=1871086 RepID=UPI001D8AEA15|nr:retroviral-like aspartic protease family protein [Brevundimonas sp.]MBL0948646.1 retroviral-like aspartic protease family protein [Brevundimonas sp.]
MTGLDRRTLILSAAGLAVAGPVHAVQEPEPRLLTNILTRVAAEVELNGRKRYALVLDTGAGRTVLADTVARELNLPEGPPVLVHAITSAEVLPTVRLARLDFAGRRITDLICPVVSRDLLAADGLLGLDVLSRYRLSIDLARRRVSMRPSGSDVFDNSPAFASPSRLTREGVRAEIGRFGQLILPTARVGGVTLSAFIDTGAQYSIGNLALLDALGAGRADPSGQDIEVYGVTGQVLMAREREVRGLEIASRDLGPTTLLFADLHAFEALDLIAAPALLIGADILYRFRRVELDYGRRRMALSGLRPPLSAR